MSNPASPPVLARIIAAHNPAPSAAAGRDDAAARGFGRALRHAATPFAGFDLQLTDAAFDGAADLPGALAALPDHGLVAALEDGSGHRGLVAICNGLVDALIEVQTTGTVEQASLPPRPVTQIDEAMCRDFLDLTLAAMAREGDSVPGRDWPIRMQYGSRIADRGQISLLLPDGPYRIFDAALGFAGADRTGRAVLIVPGDPALARAHAPKPAASAPVTDAEWTAALVRVLASAPLGLEAVLIRLSRPLADLRRLSRGDVLAFAPGDLSSVRLEDGSGRSIATGRLGQLGGKRAIRITGLPHVPARAAPPGTPPDQNALPRSTSATPPPDPQAPAQTNGAQAVPADTAKD